MKLNAYNALIGTINALIARIYTDNFLVENIMKLNAYNAVIETINALVLRIYTDDLY